MLHNRSYSPETVAIVGAAFDRACHIPKRMNYSADVKKRWS
jgi:hypothetical protein